MPTSLVLATNLYIILEGATIDAVVVSRTAKPDVTPVSNWGTGFGVVEYALEEQHNEIVIERAVPGHTEAYDVLETNRRVTHRFVLNELSPLLVELLLRASVISMAAGASQGLYVPGRRGSRGVRAWIKAQQYSPDDVLINTLDAYGNLMAETTTFRTVGQTEEVRPTIRLLQLYSPLNVGKLETALT